MEWLIVTLTLSFVAVVTSVLSIYRKHEVARLRQALHRVLTHLQTIQRSQHVETPETDRGRGPPAPRCSRSPSQRSAAASRPNAV